ncbi:MAG: YgcG family protein [Leptothrix ochracea]|uniref:TPM domain-containing protein n=1 Tax=Leptothrix ochracea TaxID=735331 RepID=UPI0034E26A97
MDVKRYLTNWFRALGVLGLLFWAGVAWAGQEPVPTLTGSVTDVAGVLSAQQRQTLEERLAQLAASGPGRDVRVVVVAGTQPESIEAYTQRLVQQAHAGDAVLIVVAVEDRKMRIEVPRALSSVISDAAAQSVIDQQLKPAFRGSHFAGGLLEAVGRIGEMLRTVPAADGLDHHISPLTLFWGVLGLFVGALVLSFVMASLGSMTVPLILMSLVGGGVMLSLADLVLSLGAAVFTGGVAFAVVSAIDGAAWMDVFLPADAPVSGPASLSNSFSSSGYSSSDSSSSSSSDSGGGGGASGDW